jgi:hypothetical protein
MLVGSSLNYGEDGFSGEFKLVVPRLYNGELDLEMKLEWDEDNGFSFGFEIPFRL